MNDKQLQFYFKYFMLKLNRNGCMVNTNFKLYLERISCTMLKLLKLKFKKHLYSILSILLLLQLIPNNEYQYLPAL